MTRESSPPLAVFRRTVHDLLVALGLRDDPGSWVIPGQVLVCAYPRTNSALAALANAGVTLLVNLHPRRHDPAALTRHRLAEVHLPTPDFTAPSAATLRRGVAAIEEALANAHGGHAHGGHALGANAQRVAVHCGGGRGRAGTLVACLLVARGARPADAISLVRRHRPGAVETRGQEAAVEEFASSTRARPITARAPGAELDGGSTRLR